MPVSKYSDIELSKLVPIMLVITRKLMTLFIAVEVYDT